MLRLFIALDLSVETKQKLYAHMLPLKKKNIQGSWVRPENLHVTLKFLGDTDDYCVPMLQDMLTVLANQTTRIKVTISHISAFPSLRAPRIIFFEVKETDVFTPLIEYIENRCVMLGFPKENKKFTPHITFCRVKQHCNLAAEGYRSLLDIEPVPYTFKDITLFRSVLTSSGAFYEELLTCPFHL